MAIKKEIFEKVEQEPKPTTTTIKKNIKRPNKMTQDEIELLALISQKLNPEKPKQKSIVSKNFFTDI
jgi:hypothetical protein